jgi:hypothetical protein
MQLQLRIEVAERRRANLSILSAQSLLPEFDYSGRKFTPSNSGASAGFRPHLKQGVIFTEQVALRNLVSFRARPSLGCHFQELDERGDILFLGVHDNPPFVMQGKLHVPTDAAVSGITKRRNTTGAVVLGITKRRISGGNELLQASSESAL